MIPRWNSTHTFLTRIANSWVFATAIGVLAFLLASLKTDQIKHAFPTCCFAGIKGYPINPLKWTVDRGAAEFWIAASIWAFLVAHRNKAESERGTAVRNASAQLAADVKAIQAAATALDANMSRAKMVIEDVNYAVQTLPSKEFRTAFAVQSRLMYGLLGTSMPRQLLKDEDPAESIRFLLSHLLDMRRLYEGNISGRYAANVMIFVKRGSANFTNQVAERALLFAPTKTDELEGALVLFQELSTCTSNSVPGQQDHQVAEIAISIPLKPELRRQGSAWVLPGAAEAFLMSSPDFGAEPVYSGISGFHDTRKIEVLLRDYNVPEKLIETFREYFSFEGKAVRSFISLPLQHPSSFVFGVLNIHSDKPFPSGDQSERQLNFGLIMSPLVNEIAEAVTLWAEKKNMSLWN